MNLAKTGLCPMCIIETREGMPVSEERPLFFNTCPFDNNDEYSRHCQFHYSFSGHGEPASFFKVKKSYAKAIFNFLYKSSKNDIKNLKKAINIL